MQRKKCGGQRNTQRKIVETKDTYKSTVLLAPGEPKTPSGACMHELSYLSVRKLRYCCPVHSYRDPVPLLQRPGGSPVLEVLIDPRRPPPRGRPLGFQVIGEHLTIAPPYDRSQYVYCTDTT